MVKIVGKDLNLHIANSSAPAASLALEYAVTEVRQTCNKQEVMLACTDHPFIFKALGNSEEESEEEIRKSVFCPIFCSPVWVQRTRDSSVVHQGTI